MTIKYISTAELVALLFDNDGQAFTSSAGLDLEVICLAIHGKSELARCNTNTIRYQFSDSSAIVTRGDYWDVEGNLKWTFEQDDAKYDTEILTPQQCAAMAVYRCSDILSHGNAGFWEWYQGFCYDNALEWDSSSCDQD